MVAGAGRCNICFEVIAYELIEQSMLFRTFQGTQLMSHLVTSTDLGVGQVTFNYLLT